MDKQELRDKMFKLEFNLKLEKDEKGRKVLKDELKKIKSDFKHMAYEEISSQRKRRKK